MKNHNQETCSCPRCTVSRGPDTKYYNEALSYLTRKIDYLSASEYAEMSEREKSEPRNFGRVNTYTCPTCRARIVTVDRDKGVTPAFRVCEGAHPLGTKAINASMQSAFYRLPREVEKQATHEYFRPSYEYYRTITDANCEKHVREGGLLFRKIGDVLPEGHEFMTSPLRYQ